MPPARSRAKALPDFSMTFYRQATDMLVGKSRDLLQPIILLCSRFNDIYLANPASSTSALVAQERVLLL